MGSKEGREQRKNKMNCIQWAVFKNCFDSISLLLITGIFMEVNLIDVKDEMDNNLVHLAASVNDNRIIELLLSLGISGESKNRRGHTPIDLCTDDSCKEILRHSIGSIYDYMNDKPFEENTPKYLCMKSKNFVGECNRVYHYY